MGYKDDYSSNIGEKIPYDDTPITRREQTTSYKRRRSGSELPHSKIFIVFLAFSLVLNICLCISTIYFVYRGTRKEVNVNYNTINGVTQVSTFAASSAYFSSVCVAAGANSSISNEYAFFNQTSSHGAGVTLKVDKATKTAYFLTCYHVIRGYSEKELYVMLPTYDKPIKVEKVGHSSKYDIAVLKYSYLDTNTPVEDIPGVLDVRENGTVGYAESYYLARGEQVFTVGNPLSRGFTVSSGIISSLNITVTIDGSSSYEKRDAREIKFDTGINPGNSGGGLFNSKGEFIGLVNSKLMTAKPGGQTITVLDISYAIPGTFALSIAKSIIANNGTAKFVDIGEFQNSDTITPFPYGEGENKKMLEKYTSVTVKSIKSGIFAENISANDVIESFSYTDREGKEHKDILMLNKYVFEDICFDIKPGSTIYFKIKGKTTLGRITAPEPLAVI